MLSKNDFLFCFKKINKKCWLIHGQPLILKALTSINRKYFQRRERRNSGKSAFADGHHDRNPTVWRRQKPQRSCHWRNFNLGVR